MYTCVKMKPAFLLLTYFIGVISQPFHRKNIKLPDDSLNPSTNEEISKEMADFKKMISIDELRGGLRPVIREKVKAQRKAEREAKKYMKLLNDFDNLNASYQLVNARLQLRPILEAAEILIFPAWLYVARYSVEIKWILVLEFELTTYVKVLAKELKEKCISFMTFAHAMAELYDRFSNMISHYPVKTKLKNTITEQQWNTLFTELGICEDTDKTSMKVITNVVFKLKGFPDVTEFVTTTLAPRKGSDFVIHIESLPFREKQSPMNRDALLREWCGDFGSKISKTYYPYNKRKQLSNEVFFKITIFSSDHYTTLIDNIKKNSKVNNISWNIYENKVNFR